MFTYDVLGRMTAVSEGGVLQASYTYDANGNRQSLTYANGVTATYTYNRANLLTNLTNKLGNTTLSSYAYTYKLDGNQTSKQDHTGRLTTYTYDGFGRLSEEKEVKNNVTEFSLNYTYDPYGNRVSMTDKDGGLTQYNYNKKNQLLQTVEESDGETSTSDYIYDGNGNQLIKMTTALKDADSELDEETLISLNTPHAEVNTYDPYNRLTESIAANETVTYTYRPDGLRNSKSANGITTTHLWDGANIVGDLQNGVVGATYVRGIGLIAAKDTAGFSYYLQNGHGDVIQLTNTSGTITKMYDYDAFGVERDMDAQDANPFRYCGEYFDRETETIYLRARYYSPASSRFLSQDPHWNTGNMIYGDKAYKEGELRIPNRGAILQSSNLYVYCAGNPVVFADPSGRKIEFKYSDNATEAAKQKEQYARTKEYLKTSSTGKALIAKLENSKEVITVVFNNSKHTQWDLKTDKSQIINWDATAGVVLNDNTIFSASLALAHEMGHAAQYLDGDLDGFLKNPELRSTVEAANLKKYETPIAKQLGEPTRTVYTDGKRMHRMNNSTDYGILAYAPKSGYINKNLWQPKRPL